MFGSHIDERAVWGVLEELADWLRPGPRRPRKVFVPDFTGMRMGETFFVAVQAGVKTKVVRLIEPPAAVEGIVVGQDPQPGTKVRRDTVVTLSVFHEPQLDSTAPEHTDA